MASLSTGRRRYQALRMSTSGCGICMWSLAFLPLFCPDPGRHPRKVTEHNLCCPILQRAENINPVQDHTYEHAHGRTAPQARMGRSKRVRHTHTPTSLSFSLSLRSAPPLPSLYLSGPDLILFFSQFLLLAAGIHPKADVRWFFFFFFGGGSEWGIHFTSFVSYKHLVYCDTFPGAGLLLETLQHVFRLYQLSTILQTW